MDNQSFWELCFAALISMQNLPKQWLRWNVEQIQKLHDGSVATGEKIAQSKVKELDVSEI